MESHLQLYFQIDEARRYIDDGRLERLRIALLLLDSASEMILASFIEEAFIREGWDERLKEQWESIALHVDLPEIGEEAIAFIPLTKRQKVAIERDYEEKLKYVSERRNSLPTYLVAPLLHLHRYRNEAYYCNEIRPSTIRAACLILYEIVCEICTILRPGTVTYYTGTDYSWPKERFGIDPVPMMFEWRDKVVAELKSALLPDAKELSGVLASHMADRRERFYVELDFLVRNLRSISTREEALAATFRFRLDSVGYPSNEKPKKPLEPRDLSWYETMMPRIDSIREATTRVQAFERFAQLEQDFEPIETGLSEFTTAVDSEIQLQVDIARGK